MDFLQTRADTVVGGQTGFAVPLMVAVTGHRDLVESEKPAIRDRVSEFLRDLLDKYPERGVTVMSSLAQGADQLVAEVAVKLGIPLVAVLPMPRAAYVLDFDSQQANTVFDQLVGDAIEVLELPVVQRNREHALQDSDEARAHQYAQLGVFLCAHCHILLALWDGKFNNRLGGTGQVVRFHHDDVMPGYTPKSTASNLILTDDETDLVYHIVCSRKSDSAGPASPLVANDWWWYTADEREGRSKQFPTRHERVFELTSDFSRDALEHSDTIRRDGWSLYAPEQATFLSAGVRDIDHVFRAADWLAIYFQKRMLLALRGTHLSALLMGLMYILYSDVVPLRVYLVLFLGFFLFAFIVQAIAARGEWHRKYLDYRTLAEGLRVQFYWAAAGVSSSNLSKFSFANFLQTQDADLGWIRNVMRVAGTESDAMAMDDATGLSFALSEWIGDENSGQLGYYRRKGEERARRHIVTDKLAKLSLWMGFGAIFAFLLMNGELGNLLRNPLIVMMGIMLLIVGIRQSYSHSVADEELIKQYRFMLRIFDSARRKLDVAQSDDEYRRILRVLGQSALEEHAQWILMHRERALDKSELWHVG